MLLSNLLRYRSAKLFKLSQDEFAILFDSAISHLNTQKDLLAREKDHQMISHYRKVINQIEESLATLRMHAHYQKYQSQLAALNMQTQTLQAA